MEDFNAEELRKQGMSEEAIEEALRFISLSPRRKTEYIVDMFKDVRSKGGNKAVIDMVTRSIGDELGNDYEIVKNGGQEALINKARPLIEEVGIHPASLSFLMAYKLFVYEAISFAEFQDYLVNILLPTLRLEELKNK